MKFKYIHPANCGFRPHGVYSRNEIEEVLGSKTDTLIDVLFEIQLDNKPKETPKMESKSANRFNK